jgi:hypothetical protein
MKKHTVLVLACLSLLFAMSLFAQTNKSAKSTSAQTSPAIPEEARKHFVMGTTLFKDAKTADDFAQVVSEFKQASDVAPQWPEARYNLALAKEAAGDYSGAMEDLKLYQKFKLSESEARTVQDKIYMLEAKQAKRVSDVAAKAAADAASEQARAANEQARAAAKQAAVYQGLDGGVWEYKYTDDLATQYHTRRTLEVHGHEIEEYFSNDYNARRREVHGTFDRRQFQITVEGRTVGGISAPIHFTISDDGQSITWDNGEPGASYVFRRTN